MNYVFKLVLEFERLVVATINRVCVWPSTELYSKLAIMNCVI